MAEETFSSREFVLMKKRSSLIDQDSLSEKELLEEVQAGSKEAFRIIVARHMNAAYYVALGFLRNHQDALDVSQDAFIRAYRKRKSFDPTRPFFPWFYQLLRNLCIDHIKKYRRRNETPFDDNKILNTGEGDFELKKIVWKGVNELSFVHREIIILRYFRQMSYQEISEMTGKPIGTVMSALFYAKEKLRTIIKKYVE